METTKLKGDFVNVTKMDYDGEEPTTNGETEGDSGEKNPLASIIEVVGVDKELLKNVGTKG